MEQRETYSFSSDVIKTAKLLTTVLAFSYLASLGASFHWRLDLFSHFIFQYAVGGIILGGILLYFRQPIWGVIAMTVFALSSFTLASHAFEFHRTASAHDGGNITIVSYNRRYTLEDHTLFENWLREHKEQIDFVTVLEARASHVETANKLHDIFPYRINHARQNAFGMVLMSKYPITSQKIIKLKHYALHNFAVNAVIELPDGKEFSLYAVHPPPPTSANLFLQRNNDMLTVAELAAKDGHDNIIMMGDWNITPYSPHFKKTLKVSGLNYSFNGLWTKPTWPSMFSLPLFKIPIDHILYSDNLIQISKKIGPAMASDHHPVIVKFAVK